MKHAGRQFDASPQSARKLLDDLATPIGKAQSRQHFIRPRTQFLATEPVQPAMVYEVLRHRELLIDTRRLEHDAEVRANRERLAAQVVAEDSHFALLKRNQRRKHAKQRGLAAAVRAQDREDFALRNRKRKIVNRFTLAIPVGQM